MNKKTHPTIYKLPDDYCTLIGKFITRWAYLEWRLRETMYALMCVGPKVGRIAIREPRVVDYLTMIEDTAKLRKVTISVDWKKLKNIMGEIESWRDRFAHSIWLDIPGVGMPSIQVLSGKTVTTSGGTAVKSRIDPRSFRVAIKELKNAVAGIDRAVRLVDEIKAEIEAQAKPSP